uniref:NADH dehydrogenase subunit 3 n=1 Tax=Ptosima chinensis TaxID=3025998 RepID=UPI0023AA81A4|nr:NADH dehydrogenase subunit 3 [Ptosima chinensis]WCO87659.1 NADH dehydrogenase subunit 3 [Ptosima chinensis]
MHMMLYFSMGTLCLSILVMIIALVLSMKTFSDREKNSPFECGFDPKSSARMAFSLQFFLIAIIFLIFDVEITLIMPLIIVMVKANMINYLFISALFTFILLLGLYHEWNQGALTWTY